MEFRVGVLGFQPQARTLPRRWRLLGAKVRIGQPFALVLGERHKFDPLFFGDTPGIVAAHPHFVARMFRNPEAFERFDESAVQCGGDWAVHGEYRDQRGSRKD